MDGFYHDKADCLSKQNNTQFFIIIGNVIIFGQVLNMQTVSLITFSFIYVVVLGQEEAVPKTSNEKESISCYTCGLNTIDPENDKEGSYGDARTKGYKEDKNLKMYNHTCDIADELGLDDKWVRKCPKGTKSCFWNA